MPRFVLFCFCYFAFLFDEHYGAPDSVPPPYEPPTSEEVYEEHEMKVFEVTNGKNAKLTCGSNDNDHNFAFWVVGNKDIIGPGNKFDTKKYNYEVLSGLLTIRAVSPPEEGYYTCVSVGVTKNNFNVRTIRMIVKKDWQEVYENDPNVNFFRVVIVLASLLIIMGLLYAAYKISRRHRLHEYLENSEGDDEDSGDEIFRAPGTSRNATGNIILDKPISIDTDFGKNSEGDDEDNSGDEVFRAPGTSKSATGNIILDRSISIDTDFGSILDNAQQKQTRNQF